MTTPVNRPGAVAADFPVTEECTWLVAGVVNPVPLPVAEATQQELAQWFVEGAPHVLHPRRERRRREAALATIAAAVGANPGDIALVRGVSEGFQHILRGIDWQHGDRLVLSADEEAALLLPALQLADTRGVAVDIVSPREDGTYHADDFAARLRPHTRLVAFSEVTTELGARLPAQQICNIAREAGCLSFVDAAHSSGVMPTGFEQLGCDAGGALSYKWHYGPYGLGAFYLSERGREQIALRYAGGRAHRRLSHPSGPYQLHEATRSFQYGPWLWAMVQGWADALDYLAAMGMDAIFAHTCTLADRLKTAVLDIPSVRLQTPQGSGQSAALVALSVDGLTSIELRDQLYDRFRIRVKARQNSVGIRVGISVFTSTEDVDLLIDALQQMRVERGRHREIAPISPA